MNFEYTRSTISYVSDTDGYASCEKLLNKPLSSVGKDKIKKFILENIDLDREYKNLRSIFLDNGGKDKAKVLEAIDIYEPSEKDIAFLKENSFHVFCSAHLAFHLELN